VQKLVARDLSVGVSSKGVLKNINQLIEQALGATSFCTEERKVVLFDQIYGDGLLGYINSQGGRVLAEKNLRLFNNLKMAMTCYLACEYGSRTTALGTQQQKLYLCTATRFEIE